MGIVTGNHAKSELYRQFIDLHLWHAEFEWRELLWLDEGQRLRLVWADVSSPCAAEGGWTLIFYTRIPLQMQCNSVSTGQAGVAPMHRRCNRAKLEIVTETLDG